MQSCKVWNKGNSDYSESFKGKEISIPQGGYVTMSIYDASEFKGGYPGKGVEKIIVIEPIPEADTSKIPELFCCNLCGEKFATERELFTHLKTHSPKDIEDEEPKRGRKPNKDKLNDSSSSIGND